jgi:hypothetical protein
MQNIIRTNAKIWKIVPVSLLTMMLFSTMAYAAVDIHTDQQDDSVRFITKNVGASPTYVLNALTILDAKGNTIYTSQDISSAEVLRINPGVSYTFEWDSGDVPDGTYRGVIYQGDIKRSLRTTSTNFVIKPRPGKPSLYTNKISYSYGESVDVTFNNAGLGTIYVNVNNWKITDLDTGKVVNTLSQNCSFGYGGCADSFDPLRFMRQVKQTWNQKDSRGNQVSPGSYIVTAEYSNKDPSSGKPNIKTISTKKFFLMPLRNR